MNLLEITWTDPVTERRGYVVIHSLVRGIASGGLRLRAGCTLDEVAGLARGMALKEALVYDPADRYIPLGGAKGGIDIGSDDPEAPAVLGRFLTAVLPVLRAQWNTGEDFGLSQDLLDRLMAELGLPSTIEPVFALLDDADAARERLREAFAVMVDGVPLADLVGGFGVADACVVAAERLGIEAKDATAVVQGFGTIGGAAARYLSQAGVRVVAVADRLGLVSDPEGLDVEAMLAARDRSGVIDRSSLPSGARTGGDWLDVPADILVPCAMSYVLPDAAPVRARVVVEGANMPTLPSAEADLFARGVPVVPDFLANVMTNAWWWWVVFGDIAPTAPESFAKISRTTRRLLGTVWDDAAGRGVPLRAAALDLAERNASAIASRYA
ncbi:hypothetical protein N5079_08215 [Planotetraspora sp. A-T 1434]|uniref:Glu/Leu/Phe/Val family dehydrogenase n=1 Tax=Planotetraspora sp. A-T 1434 TaxID=2979219 RepID=UPI0021C19F34|nr:Glu/Leu/Phe/Val dehydrogenase dimerization domain-containing protein [Planotetraspora sp. A-T 1434]MCT9930209.1 hypothetical protein [Planotetraspora sp. A-T 1434]